MVEGLDEFGAGAAAADALERLTGRVAELPDVLGAKIGQFMLLPVSPQVFDRIEFRSVRRQTLYVQPGRLGLDILTSL